MILLADKSKLTDINSANVCADIKYGSVDKDNDNNNKSNNDDSTKKSSSDCLHTGNSNITDNNKDVTNIKMQNDKQTETDMNNSTTIDSFNTSTNIYGCNDENMYVSISKPDGAQKKNFCLFCKKFQSNIVRHLETIHCDEKEVKKFSALPKGELYDITRA